METSVKVSICIPTYNQPTLFERALQSVLCQDFEDYEVIITDDSSNNCIKLIVEKYLPNNKIKYYKNKTTLGAPDNWNEAIGKASGEYIKILHHDDWFTEKNSLLQFVKTLDESKEANFCFSSTQVCKSDGEMIRTHVVTKKQLKELEKDPTLLFFGNIIGAPSVTMYRRTILEKYDSNMKWLVDLDLYIRILEKNTFVYLKDALIATTSNAQHQVTNLCQNNKEIEVYEYLYLYNKIYNKSSYSLVSRLRKIFYKYNIFHLDDLEFIGGRLQIRDEVKYLLRFACLKKIIKQFHMIGKSLKSKGIIFLKALKNITIIGNGLKSH